MGPAGIMHLPRLWMKLILKRRGALADEYSFTNRGITEWLTSAIGVDFDELAAFVETSDPDYLTFERWVMANAKHPTAEAIDAFHERIRTTKMPAPRGPDWQARFGLPATYDGAVALNDLDDWDVFHTELKRASAGA
jgi:hypothetical protein